MKRRFFSEKRYNFVTCRPLKESYLQVYFGPPDGGNDRNSGHGYNWYPAESSDLELAAMWGDKVMVQRILNEGAADGAEKDSKGRTPLSWAARNGHEAVVKLLLETGKADVDSKDEGYDRRTPLSWAAGNGHEAARGVVISRRQPALPVRTTLSRIPRDSVVREVFQRYSKKTMILRVQDED